MYFQGNKIFVFFDNPYIFKNIRTALFKYQILTEIGLVDSNVIRQLYILDNSLSNRHINSSPADKMKVHLATQVLSRSVAIGILIMAQLKKINKKNTSNWYATFIFILNLNKAFDCFNSLQEIHKNSFKQELNPGKKNLTTI